VRRLALLDVPRREIGGCFIDRESYPIVGARAPTGSIVDGSWLRRGAGPARIAGVEARRGD
jgi:hypothetical protein